MKRCWVGGMMLTAGVVIVIAGIAGCSPRAASAPAAQAQPPASASSGRSAFDLIGERAVVSSVGPDGAGEGPAFIGALVQGGDEATQSAVTFWFYPGTVTDDGDDVRFAASMATRVAPQVARDKQVTLVRIVVVGGNSGYPSSADPSVELSFARQQLDSQDWAALSRQQQDAVHGWEGVLHASTSYSAAALPFGSRLPRSRE